MRERVLTIIVMVLCEGLLNTSFAQTIVPIEIISNPPELKDSTAHLAEYPKNKKLPAGYEKETLAGLSYFPELENVPVKFKVRKSFCTLKTRPTFWSMFMPKGHRSYVIIISNKTIQKLNPVLFQNLPENARIGIIGHELSHVADFSKKTVWQSFKTGVGHLSKNYIDSLEYRTDKICIEHGLGKELETWSSYIRDTMHTTYWRGADFVNKGDTHYERYMNPSTIEKYMEDGQKLSGSTIINAR
jgi:hypothetical protein